MDKNIFESLDEIFRHIKHRSLLVLEHTHASDVRVDVVSEELPHHSPNVRDSHELLFEFNFKSDEVLLASQKTSREEGLFVVA